MLNGFIVFPTLYPSQRKKTRANQSNIDKNIDVHARTKPRLEIYECEIRTSAEGTSLLGRPWGMLY